MFAMDQNKTQEERILAPEEAGAGVIVSPDTRRANRVPPGQSRTRKWPILDASGPPPIALERWTFSIGGLVARPKEWNWQEFQELDRVKVFSDFHCVTRWSRLGNVWEGVSTRKLMELAGGALPGARVRAGARLRCRLHAPIFRWPIFWPRTRWWRFCTMASR